MTAPIASRVIADAAASEEDIERVASSLATSSAEVAAVEFISSGDYHYSTNFVEFENPLKEIRGRITGCLRRLNALSDADDGQGEEPLDAEDAFVRLRDAVDERCDAIDAAVMIMRGYERAYTVRNTNASDVEKPGRGFRRYDATCARPQ